MCITAKLFMIDGRQAVRLPAGFRFADCDEILIRRDPETGDVILSSRPTDWRSFVQARRAAHQAGEIPDDFLVVEPRDTPIG